MIARTGDSPRTHRLVVVARQHDLLFAELPRLSQIAEASTSSSIGVSLIAGGETGEWRAACRVQYGPLSEERAIAELTSVVRSPSILVYRRAGGGSCLGQVGASQHLGYEITTAQGVKTPQRDPGDYRDDEDPTPTFS